MKKMMMILTLFVLSAAVVSGCVKAMDPKWDCIEDEDCPPGDKCVDVDYESVCRPEGWCGSECDEDDTYCLGNERPSDYCADGEYCDLDSNECVEGECWDDRDCGYDEQCDPFAHVCREERD